MGSALNSVTAGVGTIVANTAVGLGGTAKALPSGLYKTTKNLQENTGIIGSALNTLTGTVNHWNLIILIITLYPHLSRFLKYILLWCYSNIR